MLKKKKYKQNDQNCVRHVIQRDTLASFKSILQ